MLYRFFSIVALLAAFFLTGCATRTDMAFSDDANKAPIKDKPIFLMTLNIKNTYKTSYQPKLVVVNVEKAVVKDSADRLNFVMDDKAKNETDSAVSGNSYYLRMELEKGKYVIRGFTSFVRSFPIMSGFFAPLHADLEAVGPGVYYLGNVNATVRERQGDEFKAGPSIPLIDQSVSGASGGTFDIVVSDQWSKDEAQFRSKFPVLNGVTIQKAILQPFDREKAQKWWEAN